MSAEQKELINRLGVAVSALTKDQQMYLLGRAEAQADAAREREAGKEV